MKHTSMYPVHDEGTDIDLLSRWQRGDSGAGSQLLRRHIEAVRRFFVARACAHAEDLTQQTLLACTRSRCSFRGESSFRTYLLGLARMQLYTHYRRRWRRTRIALASAPLDEFVPSPSDLLTRDEHLNRLGRALLDLSREQQLAVRLTYGQGLGAAAAARALGISENTMYSRLRRAKEQLRKALGESASTAPPS